MMGHVRMKLSILAAAAMPAVAFAAGWQELGAQGSRHFVLVAPASAGDAAVFREAASNVCAKGKPCLVLYWTDASKAATGMPLNRAQSEAVVAQLRRNPATGQDELLERCPDNETSLRCLKTP